MKIYQKSVLAASCGLAQHTQAMFLCFACFERHGEAGACVTLERMVCMCGLLFVQHAPWRAVGSPRGKCALVGRSGCTACIAPGGAVSGLTRCVESSVPHHGDDQAACWPVAPAQLATQHPTQQKAAPKELSRMTFRSCGLHLVPRRGLEPPRSYPLVPETSASTNSATWAGTCVVASRAAALFASTISSL